MKAFKCLFPAFLIAVAIKTLAGGDKACSGGRSFGMGNASVALHDAYALFNNIAGIAAENRISFFSSCQLPYNLPELKRVSAGFTGRYKSAGLGVSLYDFGSGAYNEFKAGFGIAHRIRQVSLGVKINYSHIAVAETGVFRNAIAEFGGISELSKHVRVGATIYNLNLASTGRRTKELIPVMMRAGVSISPTSALLINVEACKTSNLDPQIRGGIEYYISEKFPVRIGITTGPMIFYSGIGLQTKGLVIDYGFSSHPQLGLTHTLSLCVKIDKRKNTKRN